MRMFYALLPDVLTRERLSMATARLEIASHGHLVTSARFHITLAFVGDVPDGDVHTFRDMGALLGLRRCAIELDSFEYWRAAQAIVLAARNNPTELAEQTHVLREAVAARGHPRRDDKPWRAHVTLARKVAQAPVLPAMSSVLWVSHSFTLMRSERGGNESVYTVVDSWPLLDNAGRGAKISQV